MSQKIHAVQPRDSIGERARERHRRPAKIHDFTRLIAGKRRKRKPAYCRRMDEKYLFYHGKENAVYGETEAGKDMLLCETVAQCLEWDDAKVAWIDFEEDDEIDIGSRLLQMGVEPATLVDQDFFRFSTPEDVEAARDSIHDAKMSGCDLVIFNGLQAMYGLFGWELYDPTSPALFRQMIRPLLNSGRTVIETDHMTKTSAEGRNGSRYAAGGIAKLNWINGAAYIIEAIDPIVQGGVGRSRIVLTKDRPGGVKPNCVRIEGESRMMYAGTLHVKSTGDGKGNWSLKVDISPPVPGSVVQNRKQTVSQVEKSNGMIPDDVLEQVLAIYKNFGKVGASKRAVENAHKGKGHHYVRDAITILQAHGCIVKAAPSKSSNMAQLRYEEDWDPKLMNGKRD